MSNNNVQRLPAEQLFQKEIDVLIVNDNPQGEREIFPIPIRKRIQAAVYNEDCIHEFQLKNSYARS